MSINDESPPIYQPILAEVMGTLKELALSEEYSAAAHLAIMYATAIDGAQSKASVLERLGPKLLTTLVELGATPRSRNDAGQQPDQEQSALDMLRARRPA